MDLSSLFAAPHFPVFPIILWLTMTNWGLKETFSNRLFSNILWNFSPTRNLNWIWQNKFESRKSLFRLSTMTSQCMHDLPATLDALNSFAKGRQIFTRQKNNSSRIKLCDCCALLSNQLITKIIQLWLFIALSFSRKCISTSLLDRGWSRLFKI